MKRRVAPSDRREQSPTLPSNYIVTWWTGTRSKALSQCKGRCNEFTSNRITQLQGGLPQKPEVQTFPSQPWQWIHSESKKRDMTCLHGPCKVTHKILCISPLLGLVFFLDIHGTMWHLIWNSYHLCHSGEIKYGPRAGGYTVSKGKEELGMEANRASVSLQPCIVTSSFPSLWGIFLYEHHVRCLYHVFLVGPSQTVEELEPIAFISHADLSWPL